jgi:hypothetical protein
VKNLPEKYPQEFIFNFKAKNQKVEFNLKVEDDHLILDHVSPSSNDEKIVISPSKEEWEDFWHFLDEIDIWRWYDEYMLFCDDACVWGDEWDIKMKWNDFKVESRGLDSYPPTFRDFIKALEELTGVLFEFIHEE